ncbi:MAG: HDOD domain-containing protein [Myxococcota bacterium]|nr:HDOD domain-containing protein [Myxococcota bacterium]
MLPQSKPPSLPTGPSTRATIDVAERLRAALRDAAIEGIRVDWVFEDMLRRGVAAYVIATAAGAVDAEEAFALGLVLDLPLVHLALRDPEKAPALEDMANQPAARRILSERATFGKDHAQAYVEASERWGLPRSFIPLVLAHHDPTQRLASRRMQRLLAISRAADALADLTQAEAATGTMTSLERALADLPARVTLQPRALFQALREALPTFAAQLNWPVEEQPTWQELERHAGPSALYVSRSYQSLSRNLDELESQRRAVQRSIRDQAQRRPPERDPITGAISEPSLYSLLRGCLDAISERNLPVSVLWLAGPSPKHWEQLAPQLRASDEYAWWDGGWAVVLSETDKVGRLVVEQRLYNAGIPKLDAIGGTTADSEGLLPGARSLLRRAQEAAQEH